MKTRRRACACPRSSTPLLALRVCVRFSSRVPPEGGGGGERVGVGGLSLRFSVNEDTKKCHASPSILAYENLVERVCFRVSLRAETRVNLNPTAPRTPIVFKAQRLLYHSTLGLKVMQKKVQVLGNACRFLDKIHLRAHRERERDRDREKQRERQRETGREREMKRLSLKDDSQFPQPFLR